MTQPADWQPELFEQFDAPTRPSWWARYWRSAPRFLVLRVAYEDLLLAAIAAVMVLVVGFCFGVERGKRLVVASVPAASVPAPAVPTPMTTMPAAVVPPLPARVPLSQPKPAAGGRYVVQVASFTARDQAEHARTRLSRYGVQASVLTKGKYHVLYAAGFQTYAQATATADRLRSTYRDCFVRKLFAERG